MSESKRNREHKRGVREIDRSIETLRRFIHDTLSLDFIIKAMLTSDEQRQHTHICADTVCAESVKSYRQFKSLSFFFFNFHTRYDN